MENVDSMDKGVQDHLERIVFSLLLLGVVLVLDLYTFLVRNRCVVLAAVADPIRIDSIVFDIFIVLQ